MRCCQPLALLGVGVLLATGALCVGCACPDATVVVPIEQGRYDHLRQQYGWEGLPDYECDAICTRVENAPDCATLTGGVGAGGAGAAGAGGSNGGHPGAEGGASDTAGGATAASNCAAYQSFAYISECKLSTIEWTRPAVVCVGTVACT